MDAAYCVRFDLDALAHNTLTPILYLPKAPRVVLLWKGEVAGERPFPLLREKGTDPETVLPLRGRGRGLAERGAANPRLPGEAPRRTEVMQKVQWWTVCPTACKGVPQCKWHVVVLCRHLKVAQQWMVLRHPRL